MEIVGIIVTAFIIGITYFIVNKMMMSWRMQDHDKDLKVLRPPFNLFWVGLIVNLMLIITFIFSLFSSSIKEDSIWALIIGGPPFILMGFWLMLYAINWRIEIKDESFTCTSVFGKKREYKYTEITRFKRVKNAGGYKLYVGKRRVEIPFIIKGYENLWEKVKVQKHL